MTAGYVVGQIPHAIIIQKSRPTHMALFNGYNLGWIGYVLRSE